MKAVFIYLSAHLIIVERTFYRTWLGPFGRFQLPGDCKKGEKIH